MITIGVQTLIFSRQRHRGAETGLASMEAVLTNQVWSVEELVALLPEPEAKKPGPYKPRNS